MSNLQVKTETEISEFKGYPTFKIWELRPDGNRKDFPLFSFGVRKAQAVLDHKKELEEFVKQSKGKTNE